MACVDLPALPLQLLLCRHPEWKSFPAAVVDRDRPQGRILWVNEEARALRILPGMRYAAALGLAGDLRAAALPPASIERAVDAAFDGLRRFSPDIEVDGENPGIFWLNGAGLGRLHESALEWARLIRAALKEQQSLEATVVAGFSKFGTFAVARSSRGVVAFREPREEEAEARRVPLDRLPLAPQIRDNLSKLGVNLLGQFAALPAEGVRRRFGKEAWNLHRQATGRLQLPLEPRPSAEPPRREVHLDDSESDVRRLEETIARELRPLLESLSDRGQALVEIDMHFSCEGGNRHDERLRPAAPTTDASRLMELIHLRLAARRFPAAVTDLVMVARACPTVHRQLDLLLAEPRRDPAAANRALARIRAEFGEAAVVRAHLCEGHLPEAGFVWERLGEVRPAQPCRVTSPVLVRRLYCRPVPLPARPRHEPDGWMLRGLEQGPVARVLGPYIVSGGWWRKLIQREYHFAETRNGELLWVYYDRFRRRWFLQGRLE